MSANEEPRSNSFVECAICLEIYDDPRILPCGHTFCLKCVQSKQIVASSKSSENTHQCSICRQMCAIPAGGLEALPKNFVVNDLKGFIAQKSGSFPFPDRCALVDDGDDHGLVEYFCVDCWYPLCNLCFRFHTKSRQTMSHVVKRLADVNDTDYAKHRTQLSLTCTKHTKKDLEFYCNGCAELLCSTCCLTSHKTHDYVELNEADETFKQKITNKVAKMRDIEKITQSQLNKGKEALKSLETHEQSITADITTFADKLLQTALDKISADLKASKTKILRELTGKIITEKTKLEKFAESQEQSLALAQADVSTLEGLLPSSSNVAERAEAMKLKMFEDSDEEQAAANGGLETRFDMSDDALAWKSAADRWLSSILTIPPPAADEVRKEKKNQRKVKKKKPVVLPTSVHPRPALPTSIHSGLALPTSQPAMPSFGAALPTSLHSEGTLPKTLCTPFAFKPVNSSRWQVGTASHGDSQVEYEPFSYDRAFNPMLDWMRPTDGSNAITYDYGLDNNDY